MVVCTVCGRENQDPGGSLDRYHCGVCGGKPLLRVVPAPNREVDTVVGSALGAGVGGALFGPVGALVGFALGFVLARRNAS